MSIFVTNTKLILGGYFFIIFQWFSEPKKKCGLDGNYGTDTCEKEDLDEENYLRGKNKLFDKLKQGSLNSTQIERSTVAQANCTLWHEIRKKRVTSSMFGRIIKVRFRSPKSYKNIVKTIL